MSLNIKFSYLAENSKFSRSNSYFSILTPTFLRDGFLNSCFQNPSENSESCLLRKEITKKDYCHCTMYMKWLNVCTEFCYGNNMIKGLFSYTHLLLICLFFRPYDHIIPIEEFGTSFLPYNICNKSNPFCIISSKGDKKYSSAPVNWRKIKNIP